MLKMGKTFLGIGQLGQEMRLIGPEFAPVLGFGARNGVADLRKPKRCSVELLLVCRTHYGWICSLAKVLDRARLGCANRQGARMRATVALSLIIS